MNGKGSKRRPALVDGDVVAANWDRVFGGTKQKKTRNCILVYVHPPPRNEYSHLGDFNTNVG